MFSKATKFISFSTLNFLVLLLTAASCGALEEGGVRSVTIAPPASTTLAVGETLQLNATVQADAPISREVVWRSSDEAVASVNNNGSVIGRSGGAVSVTAASEADAAVSDSVTLNVSAAGTCPEPQELTVYDIRADTVWADLYEPMNCVDYVAKDTFASTYNIEVRAGTLTIEPGVVVAFEEGRALVIRDSGKLVAAGTADKPIILTGTSASRGYWAGLALGGAATAALEHVTIEYGGSRDLTSSNYTAPANLAVEGDNTLTMRNSTLRESAGYGLFVHYNATLPDFSGNTLSANALAPVYTDAQAAHYLLAASSYTGNGDDRIYVNPRYSQVVGDVSWQALGGTPWLVLGTLSRYDLTVKNENKLRLEAGVQVEFQNDVGLSVLAGGTLTTAGTEEKPVSLKNEAGTAWQGVLVYDGSASFSNTSFLGTGSSTMASSNNWDKTASITLMTFFGNQPPAATVFLGDGLAHSGAQYGLLFDGGGDVKASGPGCSAMTPIFRSDPGASGQCN